MVAHHELAPEVRHFDFEIPDLPTLAFIPGQFVSVKKQVEGKEITRAYSIASPCKGNRFSLCLNRVHEGIISPYLFSLLPGDEVELGEPLGYFTLRRPEHRAVFVATGTGIAPFRSMLLEHLPGARTPITLLFGVRYDERLLYRDELEQLSREHPHFRFLPTVTRPSSSWAGRIGRVQSHLAEALDLQNAEDRTNVDVYICGMKDMVDDVRAILRQQGFDRKQIIYEKYD